MGRSFCFPPPPQDSGCSSLGGRLCLICKSLLTRWSGAALSAGLSDSDVDLRDLRMSIHPSHGNVSVPLPWHGREQSLVGGCCIALELGTLLSPRRL